MKQPSSFHWPCIVINGGFSFPTSLLFRLVVYQWLRHTSDSSGPKIRWISEYRQWGHIFHDMFTKWRMKGMLHKLESRQIKVFRSSCWWGWNCQSLCYMKFASIIFNFLTQARINLNVVKLERLGVAVDNNNNNNARFSNLFVTWNSPQSFSFSYQRLYTLIHQSEIANELNQLCCKWWIKDVFKKRK